MESHTILQVFGEPVEVLVPSSTTNHTLCVCVQTSPPGGGPPVHKHEREEEFFLVLEGEYEFFENGQWVPFRKGETRVSPRNTFHGFRNAGTSEGKLLFLTNGGCHDEYFKLLGQFKLPEDMDKVLDISSHFGYYFLPPEQQKNN